MGKKIDLTGQRFGRLVVLGDSGKINKSRAVKWKCLCDCGKETEVIGASLKNGSVKSCGCSRIKDIKGNRYGMLTAVKLDRTFKGQAYWEFLCDCGKTKVIGKNSVESEHVFSCGCLQRKIASFSGKKNSKILTDYTVNKDLKEKTRLSALMQKEGKKNTSGKIGVLRYKDKWVSRIDFKGVRYHLGYFDNKQDAINARKQAEEKYFKPILDKYGKESK